MHAVWKIKVPPKVHIFLWLISHNKILTRDNLVKRQSIDDLTCVFCSESETCCHLFFECVVAKVVWREITQITGGNITDMSFESMDTMWLCEKKYEIHNAIHATALGYLEYHK